MGQKFEIGPEHIPSKEEVLEIIGKLMEGEEIFLVREKYDEQGLYLFEVKTIDLESDESVHFEYRRKGKNPEGSTAETVINIEFYEGEQCVGGHNVADYDSVTGLWRMIDQ